MNRRDLGKEPIAGDNPAGTDVSYSDDYGALVEEIKKLSSPTSNSSIDWTRVNSLSQKILGEESKNLLVACFLNVSLLKTDGLTGCADGVHILRDLLENFWDILFPSLKRKKGRINALAWWNDQLTKLTAGLASETWEAGPRQELMDDLAFVDDFIGEKLPDGPILRQLIEGLSNCILEQEAVEPDGQEDSPAAEKDTADAPVTAVDESTVQPSVAPVAPAPSIATLPDGDSGDTISAQDFFLGGIDFLSSAASRFFAENQSDPLSYRINRLAAWAQIDALPPQSKGETMLPPPDDQILNLLKDQYQAGQWSALLSNAEGNVRQYLFWLDLSYWAATALGQIGAPDAALAVASDTLLFITRLSGLEKLTFQGGLPFASLDTRTWLAETMNQGSPADSSTESEGAAGLIQCLGQAQAMIAADGLGKALTFFQSNCGRLRGEKDTFSYDLALCQLMMRGKRFDLALPFAEKLLAQIDRNRLESWDPDLALSALMTIHSCYSELKDDESLQHTHTLLHRITLLAPEKTLNLI